MFGSVKYYSRIILIELQKISSFSCQNDINDTFDFILIMEKNTSPHILSTSANLLGFCLFVITSVHLTNRSSSSQIDEFTSVIAFFLILSCFFSFFSIYTKNLRRKIQLEKIADYMFVISLFGILLVILFLAFNFVK